MTRCREARTHRPGLRRILRRLLAPRCCRAVCPKRHLARSRTTSPTAREARTVHRLRPLVGDIRALRRRSGLVSRSAWRRRAVVGTGVYPQGMRTLALNLGYIIFTSCRISYTPHVRRSLLHGPRRKMRLYRSYVGVFTPKSTYVRIFRRSEFTSLQTMRQM